MKISIQIEDFDLTTELALLLGKRTDIGAVASFVGLVRQVTSELNHENDVFSMTLEHYPGMTEKALAAIVKQAEQRWKIIDATIIHRVGVLQAAEQIVLVAVASAHRGDAFAACEFIMDYLKTEAPFWKKETTADGDHWVDPKVTDGAARERWKNAE
ncbi:MAG: molybdenum cofactor biosynthesis protein MoaE [Methylophilaceae bacterium]|nr:molybdenum cofactor biosynthesis protein MoaE [Methylophilaceae bacterium]